MHERAGVQPLPSGPGVGPLAPSASADARTSWHGHNDELEVTVEGRVDTEISATVVIWDRIVHAVPEGVRLAKVVIHETPRNSAEYSGHEEKAGP